MVFPIMWVLVKGVFCKVLLGNSEGTEEFVWIRLSFELQGIRITWVQLYVVYIWSSPDI